MTAGAWVAYHYDPESGHSSALFEHEIDALRYAVKESMHVKFVPWGATIGSVSDGARPDEIEARS